MPPNIRPGWCYTRVTEPATYKTISRACSRSNRLPSVWKSFRPNTKRWKRKSWLKKSLQPSSKLCRLEYETKEVRVLVAPGKKELQEIPGETETVTERILVKPARTYWKFGAQPIENIENADGDIICLLEEPAEYRTVTREVVKKKAPTTKLVETAAAVQDGEAAGHGQAADAPRRVTIPAEYRHHASSENGEVAAGKMDRCASRIQHGGKAGHRPHPPALSGARCSAAKT